MLLDLKLDTTRRDQAAVDHVVYQGDWLRPDYGFWGNAIWRAPITGPFGKVLERAVQSQIGAARGRDIKHPQTGESLGEAYPTRWARMISMLNPAWNMAQILAGKEGPGRNAPLYRDPIQVDGIEGLAWERLRTIAGLDAVLVEKQKFGVALGSAGVGICLDDPRYPPVLQAYAPHEITLLPYPWDPRRCAIAVHHRSNRHVVVSDIVDWREPIYGEWRSLAEWRAGYKPLWSLGGPEYPFRWVGEPLTHIISVQGRQSPDSLQPSARSLRQLAIDTILQLGWCRLVARVGSFVRPVVVSEGERPPLGLEELSMEPTAVAAVWGGKAPQVREIGHSLEAATKLYEIARDEIQTHLSALDGDLRLRSTEAGVQSGRAIEIEREGVEDYAKDQMRTQRQSDEKVIGLLAATYNWQVIHRLIDPAMLGLESYELIPEERPVITYPLRWSQAEREQIAGRLELTDPTGAEAVRRGVDPHDDQTRAAIFVDLRQAARERAELAMEGYGVEMQVLYQAPRIEQKETETFIPPAVVATEAARGLRLQAEFRSRWGGLAVKDLLARARRIQQQDPFQLGEVRALSAWLEAHANEPEDGSAGAGTWGDETDPSGEWIAYLSQGGDPGRAWCAEIL